MEEKKESWIWIQTEIPFEEYKSRQLEIDFNSDLYNNLKEWTNVEDAEKKQRINQTYDVKNVES